MRNVFSGECLRWAVLPSVLLFSSVVAFSPAAAQSTQRSVRGRVVSAAADAPISGAIVYLSDVRTLTVTSYITQQDGAYRFEQLSPNDDYKLWAKADGKTSKVKTLSSFDERSVFHVILKIDTKNHGK